jgi:ATP-binding cassette, subfamily C (CFTR/MRP), member 1
MAAYPNFMASVSCFERIQKFLLSEDRKDHRLFNVTSRSPSKSVTTVDIDSTSGPGIELHRLPLKPDRFQDWAVEDRILTVEDGSFSIKDREEPILHDINISFRRSSFTMIVGPVGSGKSILLKSLLGEIPSSKGFVRVNSGSAAYCDQTSWLVNDTIRQNILGESNFDQQWYATVLHACALNDDLVELPNGDESLVGSGGVTLSGGQKQRLVSFFPFLASTGCGT